MMYLLNNKFKIRSITSYKLSFFQSTNLSIKVGCKDATIDKTSTELWIFGY